MTITLRNNTPAHEQLKPAATEAELRWFRKKRLIAVARTTLVTGGMCVLYFVGSMLRDARQSDTGLLLFAAGLIMLTQVGLMVHAISSTNLVREIKARRAEKYMEQRKRIFLKALDENLPGK